MIRLINGLYFRIVNSFENNQEMNVLYVIERQLYSNRKV